MDMRQIRHFLAVVEHGNFGRAAEAIHLSQPALSKSIHNLETELDAPLLTRGPRGVTPTIYGTLLLQHARLLQNHGEQAMADIRALKTGSAGHLRLGVASFAISFLPRVVATLLARTPGLTFEVVDGTYEALTALVREGALDAVVGGFPPLHRAEDLVHEALVAAEVLLVSRPEHPILTGQPVSWEVLAEQRWILANHPQAFVDLVELVFRTADVRPPKPVITSGSMIFLKSMLLEGDFVTVLPLGIVGPELDTGALVAIPFSPVRAATSEGIIYRADAVHPPALFSLIEAIRQEAATKTSPAAKPLPSAKVSTSTRSSRRRTRSSVRKRPRGGQRTRPTTR